MRIPKIRKSTYAEKYLRSALKNIGVKRANARGTRGSAPSMEGISRRFRVHLPRIRGTRYY